MKKKIILIVGSGSDIAKNVIKYLKKNYIIKKIPSSKCDFKNLDNLKYIDLNFKFDHVIFFSAINNPKFFCNYKNSEILDHLNVNLNSIILIIKKILPIFFKTKQTNKIILISSLYANFARYTRLPYSVSKFALKGLCKNLAVETAGKNIIINCIAPGFVDTKLTRRNLNKKTLKNIIKKTPIKKLVNKRDISYLIEFLLSENSNSINGQHLVIDGGISCNGNFGL
jgi:3-oxoacyl-[acyl-carrier protein] reductase